MAKLFRSDNTISEIEPYINWLYFYHTWGLSGKPQEEKLRMKGEAIEMLKSWEGKYLTHTLFALFDANSDGDDILIENVRLPMLRQQHPSAPNQPNLCLADFIRPLTSDIKDKLGVFCVSVDGEAAQAYKHDEYLSLLAQVVSDRLAEASAERLHAQVRKTLWGYAPDETLRIEDMFHCQYQGIRPASGYPSLPDTSVNFEIDQLLDMKQIGIRLTESGMMTPHSSICGFMFAHPQARYFDLGKIGEDQLRDYAHRRGIPVEMMRKFLQSSLIKR